MRRVIRRHIRRRTGGVDVAADVNVVIAVNRGTTQAETVQSSSVVQGAAGGAEHGDGEPAPEDRHDSNKEER